MKPLFATIKKLPRQRALTREVVSYSNPLRIAARTANFRSNTRSLRLTFTTSFTIHHLLSVESGDSLLKLSSDSVCAVANMPPRKRGIPSVQEVSYG